MGIGILCSGGDSAGMNPAVRHFVDKCISKGEEPYFIYSGFEGMIDGKIKKATHKDVSGILYKGGTIIKSSRSKRFFEKKYRERAYEQLKKHEIEKLVVLGGNGSFKGLKAFHEDFGIKFVGIPATIDNDIYATEYCLGVDTALNVIRSSLDYIRDTASSFKRAFVIEIMGRECGYLALVSALTSGAEVCVIPELGYNLNNLRVRLEKEIEEGRDYILAIVAEGTEATNDVAEWLKNELYMDTRITVLGHIQRGGNPTVYDRLMGYEFIEHGLEALLYEKIEEGVVVFRKGEFFIESIDYVASNQYKIKDELLKLAGKLTGVYV